MYLQETSFSVVNTGFEAQQRSNLYRLVEADVADVAQFGSELAEKVARSPGDFQRLPHQEATKHFIVQISILKILTPLESIMVWLGLNVNLWVAENYISEIGVLHPSAVEGKQASVESRIFWIDSLQKEIVDDGLLLG